MSKASEASELLAKAERDNAKAIEALTSRYDLENEEDIKTSEEVNDNIGNSNSDTKKLIGTVLILIGIVSIGVVAFSFYQGIDRYGFDRATRLWRWEQNDILKVAVGTILFWAGLALKK